MMRRVCWAALVATGSGLAASGACRLADAFRSPHLEPVVLTYAGDSVLMQGTTIALVVAVSANGETVPNLPLAVSSSDSTIVAVTAGGDSLAARALGRADLTIRVESSVLSDSLPTLTQALRVRP